jgi:hypothetical protein
MSLNLFSAALRRDEAAIDELPQMVTVPFRELSDVAAALARIESFIAGDGLAEPNGGDALERMSDIAFVLHEREVEASLCDALDAAVRDIAAAGAHSQERAQKIRQAAQMLRDLSRRVDDLIAQTETAQPAKMADAIEDDSVPAVALLPHRAESASALRRDAGDSAAPPSVHAEQTLVIRSGEAAAAESGAALLPAGGTAAAMASEGQAAANVFIDEDLLLPETPSAEAIANAGVSREISLEEPPRGDVLPIGESLGGLPRPVLAERARGQASPNEEASRLLNPGDDPDDLFEPIGTAFSPAKREPVIDVSPPRPMPPAEAAPAAQAAWAAAAAILAQPAENATGPTTTTAEAPTATAEAKSLGVDSSVAGSNPAAPRAAAPAPAPTIPHASHALPAPRDPLAAIRALSDEEMIALFT